jgi:putative chitinase
LPWIIWAAGRIGASITAVAIIVTLDQIQHLAPNVRSSYREAFQNGQAVLNQCGISETAMRVCHFMAQVLHESSGLAFQIESLNYSAERLPAVWPSRFKPKGPLDPAAFAHNQQKLGNEVYGGRMGNTGPNDGFTYRGRGLLQLTGKDSYQEATTIVRAQNPAAPDFVALPDAVFGGQWCLAIAAAEWTAKGCNAFADQDDIRKVTRAINGGLIGLSERTEWLRLTKAVWLPAVAPRAVAGPVGAVRRVGKRRPTRKPRTTRKARKRKERR